MGATSPLVFRPSMAQRAITLLLCAGSWFAGMRGLIQLAQNLPHLLGAIRVAEAGGQPTSGLWASLGLGVGALVGGGVLLLLALLALILVEGTQVLVDDLGITVELGFLPGGLARRLGAGRLGWKRVRDLEKGRFFFRVVGGGLPEEAPLGKDPVLRFLVVEELERLVLLILERSTRLHFDDEG